MHSPMVSDLDRIMKLPLKLHGKNVVFASAVVDAVEDVDVALYAAQFLFGLACCIDEIGLIAAQAVNQAVLVVLAVIELHEVDNALNDLCSQGIGITVPCLQQDGKRFLVNLCADALELRKH